MCLGYVYITCSVMKVVITVPLPIKPILSTVMFMNNRKTPGTRNILKNPWSSFAVWSAKITDNVLDLFYCFSNQNFLLLWVGLLWKLGNSCLHIEYLHGHLQYSYGRGSHIKQCAYLNYLVWNWQNMFALIRSNDTIINSLTFTFPSIYNMYKLNVNV